MKQKLLLIALTLKSIMLFSQAVPTAFKAWETNAGIQAMFQKNITKVDASGNVYTAGATLNANGKYDIFLTKVSSGGTLIYNKQINGTSNDQDFALGLVIDGTNVFMTGTIMNGTVTPIPQLFLVKYNSSGTQQFLSTYSGGYGDVGKDLVINTTYSTCIVTGASYNSSFTSDMVVVAFDMNSGAQNWVNGYGFPYGANDAGIKVTTRSNNCTVTSAVTSAANQYKLVSTSYTVSTGWGTGTLTAGAVATSSVEIISDVFQDASGNFYLVGATQQNAGQGYNIYVAKVTSSLTIAYETTINGFSGSSLDDFGKGITVDASGNSYISCVTTHSTQGKNLTVVKLNSSGTVQWTKNINNSFNGNDGGADISIDSSNDIYVTGYQTIAANNTDIYTAKLANATGNIIWEKSETNPYNDEGTNIIMDNNSVLVAGSHETVPGTFEYVVYKYDQYDILPFTDLNNEVGEPQFEYIPNKGQLFNTNLSNETDVLFYNLSDYPETYIAQNHLTFLQFHVDTIASTTDSIERIDLKFNNCNALAKVYKEGGASTTNYNFFKGNVSATGLHSNKKIISPEIYTGIDLHYYSNSNGIKAYFVVKPFADPRQIQLLLQGHQSATITSNNLKINGLLGSITLRKPNVYNINGGTNVPVTGTGWVLSGNTATINTASYTTSLTLVIEFSNIDPYYLNNSSSGANDNLYWCTYIGNSSHDDIRRVATDKYNNKYIAGTSNGNNYPTTTGIVQGSNTSGTAAVISKFNNINQLLHSTYYGGTATGSSSGVSTAVGGIVIDSLQNVFFVGSTNTYNFPHPILSNQPAGSYHDTINHATNLGGYTTAFIVKLDSSMKYKLWSTLMGDSKQAGFTDVIINNTHDITVVGGSLSSGTTFNFPTPPSGAYYNTLGNGILFRFSNNGVPQYATRMAEQPKRIVYNKKNGDYFVTSYMDASSLGKKFKNPGGGAYYDNTPYLGDQYLARFNNQDSITWATVFGGTLTDIPYDMDLKDSTLIIVGGSTGAGFPIKYQPGQYVDSTHSSSSEFDITIIRFNSYTGKHVYSSYYGNNPGEEEGYACAIDNFGNYYIAGRTTSNSSAFVTQTLSGFYNNSTPTLPEGYILSYSANNNKRLTTYFGGDTYNGLYGFSVGGDDIINDLAITSIGDLYAVGTTASNNLFPLYASGNEYYDYTQNGTISASCCGPQDGFVAAFNNLNIVGIHELDKNHSYGSVQVYPNPSNGIYNIVIEGLISNKIINFNLYNTLGQIVFNEQSKTPDAFLNKQINLSSLAHGIYFMNIMQGDKNITVKLIKE